MIKDRTYRLDRIHDAVMEVADEGSIRGKLDFASIRDQGTGLLSFAVDGVSYTIDLYRSEDAQDPRPAAPHLDSLIEGRDTGGL